MSQLKRFLKQRIIVLVFLPNGFDIFKSEVELPGQALIRSLMETVLTWHGKKKLAIITHYSTSWVLSWLYKTEFLLGLFNAFITSKHFWDRALPDIPFVA